MHRAEQLCEALWIFSSYQILHRSVWARRQGRVLPKVLTVKLWIHFPAFPHFVLCCWGGKQFKDHLSFVG